MCTGFLYFTHFTTHDVFAGESQNILEFFLLLTKQASISLSSSYLTKCLNKNGSIISGRVKTSVAENYSRMGFDDKNKNFDIGL